MSTEMERIAEQLRRAYEGGAWCGTSLREALAGVGAEQAARRAVAGAHSIWELVLHAAGWKEVIRRRIGGEPVQAPAAGDFPPVEATSEEAWQRALALLEENHRRLSEAVEGLEESRLDEPVAGGTSSLYVTLHGITQHDLYHAAQIALLKKA